MRCVDHGGRRNIEKVQHIITDGTIDERIMKALQYKDRTQSALIDAVRANLRK